VSIYLLNLSIHAKNTFCKVTFSMILVTVMMAAAISETVNPLRQVPETFVRVVVGFQAVRKLAKICRFGFMVYFRTPGHPFELHNG
jgi:cystathionine beta-lyase/cystathionine gamma-synthase